MNLPALLLVATPALDLPALPPGDCLEADFRQTRSLPALSQPLVMQGALRLRGPQSFEWHIHAPYRYGFLIEGERITETLPDGSTREIDIAQAPWLVGMQKVFAALLGGNASAITDWFSVEHNERLEDGITRLVLRPTSGAVAESVHELEIEYGAHLRSVLMQEGGDGSIEIRFEPLQQCPGS